MTFIISKLIWVLLRPLNALLLCVLAAFVFARLGYKKISIVIASAVLMVFLLFGYTNLSDFLLDNLEQRFGGNVLPENPAGIIILGGGLDSELVARHGGYGLETGADRLIAGFELQNRFPDIPVIYSGGFADPSRSVEAESVVAGRIAVALYGNTRNLLFETLSRNTWENALETRKLIQQQELASPAQNPWILVTSAYHMTRAIGCFKKVGIRVSPWKTDYNSKDTSRFKLVSNPNEQLIKLQLVMKEWLGMLVYTWMGRMDWPVEAG